MNRLQSGLQQIELSIVAIAGRAGPLLAPVPTAYLVYAATLRHLAWPWSIAVVAAVVIECLGLASTGLALELYDYNKRKLISEPNAPVKLAGVLVGLYFVVAIGLTVLLDTYPSAAHFAPAIFPMLSLTGVSIMAIRSDHKQRVEINARAKTERAEERKSRQEAKRKAKADAEVARKEPEASSELPAVAVELPEWLPVAPKDIAEFTVMVREGSVKLPEGITGAEMAAVIPAIKTDRTGRNWIKAGSNGHS